MDNTLTNCFVEGLARQPHHHNVQSQLLSTHSYEEPIAFCVAVIAATTGNVSIGEMMYENCHQSINISIHLIQLTKIALK